MKTNIILPASKIHKTPRLLVADAYTFGSNDFESDEAKEKSVYYMTFRKKLETINPHVYAKGDHRIVVVGLQRILERLFYEPVTHAEIDEAKRFASDKLVSTNGLETYRFPEQLWRRVVDEFNGRPPILVEALPEGSVVYPNEPVVKITSLVNDFGVMAAWFESKLLQMWAPSERVTQNEHFCMRLKERILRVEPDMAEDQLNFIASTLIHDFGDRAGICEQESEDLGMVHLYTFGGSDTFSGMYQAWKNSGEAAGIGVSVNALAHRNVQSFSNEGDAYTALYNFLKDGQIGSFVGDCYNFKRALRKHFVPLALESQQTGNGKIVVARPDSTKVGYTDKDQVVDVCETAEANGLYTEKVNCKGETFKYATFLKFIEGNGMDFKTILDIIDTLIEKGFAFYSWGLYGVGGGLRNDLKRDNTSAKYALCSVGLDNRPVVKASETPGKSTLPGDFILLRSPEALAAKETVVFTYENGTNALVEFFNGIRIIKPFGPGQDDDFLTIKARIKQQMKTMPLNLETVENHNYPASKAVLAKKSELLEYYSQEELIVA
jgi:nicotinamide phosphoribosyltransferase